MSNDPKKRFKQATEEIDLNLGSLFGSLGDAIGEMVSRLEDGTSGAVARDHVFDTEKGPVRAQAGVRLRMGGLDTGQAKRAAPQPVNPNREKATAPAAPKTRGLSYEMLEDTDAWVLTADLPGVARKDLTLCRKDAQLVIETTGTRRYHAAVDMPGAFELEDIKTTLRNGILNLNIPKAGAA